MAVDGVTRELLVRYLDTWTPTALHSARGATFAQVWMGPPDIQSAEAALRVFAEFTDRLRGRRLAIILAAPEIDELQAKTASLQKELGTPPELSVYPVQGADKLAAALKAAGAAGAPLLTYVDAPDATTETVTAGKPNEMFLVSATGGWDAQRQSLTDAGFTLTAGVDLVSKGEERLLGLATSSAKSLEAFKNELWAVDEYAGVRYRDPRDPKGEPMDITLQPNPGALRRELLNRLKENPATVTELKRFALTDTIFRAADATRVLQALLHAGSVTRTPEGGKLGGDVTITIAG
jgi:hypothetical protein